jgi:hypothetical protein
MLIPLFAITIGLAPFAGPQLPGTIPGTAKFTVHIAGRARQTVSVRAVGVPAGYIASFCTDRVCAPFAVTFALPKTGSASIELQLIENTPGAHAPRRVTVTADGTAAASIAFSRAVR